MSSGMDVSLVSDSSNATIAYDQTPKPYHALIAKLAAGAVGQKTGRVLDVGCGTGNTLIQLRALAPDTRFFVADIDARCIDLCRERLEIEQSVLISDESGIVDFAEEFDVIIHSHVLQYDVEPLAALQALVSNLAPGGVLVVAISNAITPTKIMNTVLRKPYSEGALTWDRTSFANLMRRVDGASVVDIAGDYVPIPLLYRYRFGQKLGVRLVSLFPWLCFSLVATLKVN